MKLAGYSVLDQERAEELVRDPDFAEAFAGAFALLGICLVAHPHKGDLTCEKQIGALRGMDVAHDWPFGTEQGRIRAQELLTRGNAESEADLERAFTVLFRGPGKLPAAPWSSVYTDREQVLYGETWFELRDWMRRVGLASSYDEREPEDQIGRLMVMASQVERSMPQVLCEFLGEYVLPWSGRFFELFERPAIEASPTYGAIAVLARESLEDVRELLGIVPAKRRLYR